MTDLIPIQERLVGTAAQQTSSFFLLPKVGDKKNPAGGIPPLLGEHPVERDGLFRVVSLSSFFSPARNGWTANRRRKKRINAASTIYPTGERHLSDTYDQTPSIARKQNREPVPVPALLKKVFMVRIQRCGLHNFDVIAFEHIQSSNECGERLSELFHGAEIKADTLMVFDFAGIRLFNRQRSHVVKPLKKNLGWRETSAALNAPNSGDPIAVAFLLRYHTPALFFESSSKLLLVSIAHALFFSVPTKLSDAAPLSDKCKLQRHRAFACSTLVPRFLFLWCWRCRLRDRSPIGHKPPHNHNHRDEKERPHDKEAHTKGKR
jgi:hypothetical protein